MDRRRKFQREEAKRKLEEERRKRELEFQQQQEEFLRRSTKQIPVNKEKEVPLKTVVSVFKDEGRIPSSSYQKEQAATKRTQEVLSPVVRRTEATVSFMDNPTSTPIRDSHHSNMETTTTPTSKLVEPATKRAKHHLTDESSDEESVDLIAYAKAISQGQPLYDTKVPLDVKQSSQTSPLHRVTGIGSSTSTSPDSGGLQERKSPKNPFTLTTMSSSSSKQSPTNALLLPSTNTDNLWGDSDIDEDISKKTKTEKVKKSIQSRKKPRPLDTEEREHYVESTKSIRQMEIEKSQSIEDGSNINMTELKPNFDCPKFGPLEFEPLVLNAGDLGRESPICVPASISRYLPPYQKEGIQFLYNQAIISGHGAVLGDDMGLGKTVQVIGLLSALLKKKGDGSDLMDLFRRKDIARKNLTHFQNIRDMALEQGNVPTIEPIDEVLLRQNKLPDWAPILIIVPNSVIQNWTTDFATWGHFSVVVYRGEDRESALEQIEIGGAEILLMGKSLMTNDDSFHAILEPKGKIRWKVIIVDEFHQFKNFSKRMAENLRKLRNAHTRSIIGLTGTLMQNDHSELWNLVDIVYENFLGSRKEFDKQFGKPIRIGMAKTSTLSARKHAEEKQLELSRKMPTIHKRRLKEHMLKDLLPMKDERVVFCKPSPLQVKIYKHLLSLPDFDYLRKANVPCDCGVNKRFFVEYQQLTSREEQIAYQRRNRDNIIPRKQCCFKAPPPHLKEAVIWRQNHEDGEPCQKCPFCISLPALTVLNKLSSHVSLLQVEVPPNQINPDADPKKWETAKQQLEQAEIFLPDSLLDELPGRSRVQKNGLMNDHCNLSGKMAVLKRLLSAVDAQQGRVLLFSSSTKMLDLVEDFINSEGYTYLRMDGSTDTTKRNEIVDVFKRDTSSFVFLLSTKAMGLGLNLTEAAFVIIFDVEWNPSWDSQAQDRAYRIGQQKNVNVFRLVTKGTIEEIKYLRQVYKTHLTHATIPDHNQRESGHSTRLFDGVAKDKYRRGELFGIANLLKFSDTTFMNYATRRDRKELNKHYGQLKNDMYSVEVLQSSLKNMSDEEKDAVFLNEEDVFPNLARRKDDNTKSVKNDDDDDDDNKDEIILGGESQLILDICDDMENRDHVSTQEVEDRNIRNSMIPERMMTTNVNTVLNHSLFSLKDQKTNGKLKRNNSKGFHNFSLVGHSAQTLRQTKNLDTSFDMFDFAVPNNKGKKAA